MPFMVMLLLMPCCMCCLLSRVICARERSCLTPAPGARGPCGIVDRTPALAYESIKAYSSGLAEPRAELLGRKRCR